MRTRQEAQGHARTAAQAASGPSSAAGGAGVPGSSNGAASVGAAAVSAAAAARAAPARPSPSAPPVASRAAAPPQQRTVISVTGLSPRIAKEEIMRRQEYFGQYGKILRVALQNAPTSTPGPPSFACQITYASRDEAEQARDTGRCGEIWGDMGDRRPSRG